MHGLKRVVPAWLLAALVTVLAAVILQTQNVIARLNALGGDIGMGERLSMTAYDILHLGSLYGIFTTIALAVAFLAGTLVYKVLKFGRPVIYMTAGAVAMIVMLFAMKSQFFDVHIIAGARDSFGIALQMLAGVLGGFVFSRLTRRQIKTPAQDQGSQE